MKWFFGGCLLFLSVLNAGNTTAAEKEHLSGDSFAERSASFLAYCAKTKPSKPDFPKDAMPYYASRILLDQDTEYAIKGIDRAADATIKKGWGKNAAHGSHDMDPFNKHALLHAYLICKDKLPAETVKKICYYMFMWAHKDWKGYGSMNYRLMKDGSGFIAAEQWPEMKDAEGLDSAGIKEATSKRLYHYFQTIVTKNLDEYNAPIYYITDVMVVRMLAEFAQDPEMRKRATMTLDWMMLNLACSWNQGYYISSAGRAKYWWSTITGPDGADTTTATGWLYFGGLRPIAARYTNPGATFWMAYPGKYSVPEIIVKIARDRKKPFSELETVLSLGGCDIRKYTWMSNSYGLASQWEKTPNERASLYKETRRKMLKWISDKPASTFSPQQENMLRPYRPKDVTKNHFGYGENPFEQILQHEGTQVAIYSVPEKFPFHKLYVPFTLQGAILKRIEKDGWVACHGGSMLFAFKSLKPCAWGKAQSQCDILWCEDRTNAWILETSELADFAGGGIDAELAKFLDALQKKTSIDAAGLGKNPPEVSYTSLTGNKLELKFRPHGSVYTDQCKVNGKTVDYRSYPLLGNPWVEQQAGATDLTLKYGSQVRKYDFKNWQVK